MFASINPAVVVLLGNDSKARLHAGVTESANLAAEDGVVARGGGGELEAAEHTGDGVLLEAHARDEEAVNHVEGAQAQVDGAVGGQDQDGGDDVVVAVRVVRIKAEGIACRCVDQSGADCSVDAIRARIAEVPLKLDAGDFDLDGVEGGRLFAASGPEMLAGDGHPGIESDEGGEKRVIGDEKEAAGSGRMGTGTRAQESHDQKDMRDDEQPEDGGQIPVEEMIKRDAVQRSVGWQPFHSQMNTQCNGMNGRIEPVTMRTDEVRGRIILPVEEGIAMKAIVYHHYGSPDVLQCEEVERPVPAEDDVLIRVRAAGVNPLDWKVLSGGPYVVRKLLEMRKPLNGQTGVDVAGEVEAVGRNVTQFKAGDAVFGFGKGAFAEYARVGPSKATLKTVVVRKPEGLTFTQAASLPIAAVTALQGLRDKGKLQPGQKVLINGAAGGVGTFAVQIARWMGAEVTGVCSTKNLDLVRSLGADHVIDYTRDDFTRAGARYDMVFDCVGNRPFFECRRVLKAGGTSVVLGAPGDISVSKLLGRMSGGMVQSRFVSQKMIFFMAKAKAQDLTLLADLVACGKVRPVIDRCYPLEETPEAFRYLKEGHARGKVVILMKEAESN